MDIDFYQHLILATWLCLILNIWLEKRWAFGGTVLIGLLWEVAEYFYNLDAYSSLKHYLKDSLLDMGAAVLAVGVLMIILKFRDKTCGT